MRPDSKSFWLIVLVIVNMLAAPGLAVSVTMSICGGSGEVFSTQNLNLDSSTALTEHSILTDGLIGQARSVEGEGMNSIASTVGNRKQSISSEIASTDGLSSGASSYASGDHVSMVQNVDAIGESKVSITGFAGSSSSSLNSGVLKGALASSQDISVKDDGVATVQATKIFGALGYSIAEARSSDNRVQLNAGLNGIGRLDSQMTTSTSGGASASSAIEAESLTSKAYTTSRAISPEEDVYSYHSSNGKLNSAAVARADEQVSTNQNLNSIGDVLVYASTKGTSGSKSFTGEGNTASGSLSAEAGSSKSIENNLAGDLQKKANEMAPQAGNTVWHSLGGYITSNPYMTLDNQGILHTFAVGGDQALWDLTSGDWYSLGGRLTSEPYVVKDAQGRLNILARGADNALWDNLYDTQSGTYSWYGLGGYITSSPSAAVEPLSNGFLKVAVRGGDGSLWMRDIDTQYMSGSWYPLGGYFTLSPYMIFDNQGNLHTLVNGGDNALWDNLGTHLSSGGYQHNWHSYGGVITSDAKPIVDPWAANQIDVFARGSDGGLWGLALDTQSHVSGWIGFGGYISPPSGTNDIY